jgi:Tol biopolymer transport system component
LPNRRHLNWGYNYFEDARWSPDGHWIAVMAGTDPANSHFVVLSPDGQTRKDLSSWGCGDYFSYTYAWLPDSALSCITNDGQLIIGAAPFTAPVAVALHALLLTSDGGATWAPQGTGLIVTSYSDPANPVRTQADPALYQVTRAGILDLQPLTVPAQHSERPSWDPSGSTLAYVEEPSVDNYTLELSSVTVSAQGTLSLGTPRTLATGVDDTYAWSPSGHWIAARGGFDRGVDKIYLINVANPAQAVDVVLADRVGQQMMDPIWSPDSNTLIVFSVGYATAQPYALDIGAYLRSKGLQP